MSERSGRAADPGAATTGAGTGTAQDDAGGALTATDLRAVAAGAGVSVSTASRALAGSARISAATRARVVETASTLGYRPNAAARALRARRSSLAGLVVTNLDNTSLHTVAAALQQRLAAGGLQLVLSITSGDPAAERAAVATLVDHRAVGVVVVGSDAAAARELQTSGIPVVHLARQPPAPVGDCVLVDDVAGAREATEHLLGHGHRRIGLVAGPREVTSGRERRAGWEAGLAGAGVEVREHLAVHAALEPAAGDAALAALLDLPAHERPTALLVTNHEAASGVLTGLRARGLDLGGSMSVVCYEDSDLLRWWQPAVSAVDIDAAGMGALAATALLQRIAAPGEPLTQVRVRTRLVERDSCGPPPGGQALHS